MTRTLFVFAYCNLFLAPINLSAAEKKPLQTQTNPEWIALCKATRKQLNLSQAEQARAKQEALDWLEATYPAPKGLSAEEHRVVNLLPKLNN
jgi:hypothetical protein